MNLVVFFFHGKQCVSCGGWCRLLTEALGMCGVLAEGTGHVWCGVLAEGTGHVWCGVLAEGTGHV